MISQKEIDRINELARKKKSVGLTELESAEQKKLRKKYIDSVKVNLRSQLDMIEIVDDDKQKPGPKRLH